MTISLPQPNDPLNIPDHALSHRVFANDTAAPEQSVVVDSSGLTTVNSVVETVPTLLKLDQTTPQTIINGIPVFSSGADFKQNVGGSTPEVAYFRNINTTANSPVSVGFWSDEGSGLQHRAFIISGLDGSANNTGYLAFQTRKAGTLTEGLRINNDQTLKFSGYPTAGFVKTSDTGLVSIDTTTYLSSSTASSTYIPYTGGTSNVNLGVHNLTVDTNTLFVDATNHRVGIGTTTPSAKLDMKGTQVTSRYDLTDITSFSNILFSENGTSKAGFQYVASNFATVARRGAMEFVNFTTAPVSFWTNSVQRMTIVSTGKVSIGTGSDSPLNGLDVIGYYGGAVTGAAGGIRFSDSGAYDVVQHFGYNAVPAADIYSLTRYDKSTNNNPFNLLSISVGGNVGIGTTTPTLAKLQIEAGNGIVGQYINGGTTVGTDLLKLRANAATQRLILEGSSGTVQTFLEAGGSIGLFGTVTNHVFRIRTNYIDRMTFDTAGNVGIGTTAPGALLDVGGDSSNVAGINKRVVITANDNSIQSLHLQNLSTGTAAEMRFVAAANSTDYMAFTTPSSGNTGTFFGLTKSMGSFLFNRNRILALGTNAANDVVFGTNNTEKMRIQSGGNVGIGTTTPGVKLDVAGTEGTDTIRAVLDSFSPAGMSLSNNSLTLTRLNTSSYGMTIKTMVNSGAFGAGGGYIALSPNNSEAVRILINGNVGIGTTSPSARLHVISTTEQFRLGYDSSNYWNATTDSTGITTFNAVGAGSSFVFSDPTTINGNLTLGTAGNKINITEGANATVGLATLVAGTVTVNTTAVTANSRIFLTRQTTAGTLGTSVDVTARVAGTSFTITSNGSILDTSTVGWLIIN